jgi:hypothetical protein
MLGAMSKTRGGQQITDPADRALKAAATLREETRLAHEAIQGQREVAADLRAVLAEARQFVADCPGELKAHLASFVVALVAAGVEPAIRAAVAAEVAARISELRTPEPDAVDATEVDVALPGDTCPYCNKRLDGPKQGFGTSADKKPCRYAASICSKCGAVSVFDLDPATGRLVLRKPTRSEEEALGRSKRLQKVAQEIRGGGAQKILLDGLLREFHDGGDTILREVLGP